MILLPGAPCAEGASGKAVASGSSHSCVVTTTGGVTCWGTNGDGQLGDGTTMSRLTPVDVSGLTGGVVTVVAGERHTCALTTAGGVKCWGYNFYGQLGDGTTTNRTTPVDVSGLTGGAVALGAGRFHVCAVTTSGGAKCWGRNYEGELGDGTTTNATTPVDVAGVGSGVTMIDPRGYHTCALTTGGGVKCWGYNSNGQLGDGTTTTRSTPANVTGLTSGVSAITGGSYHSCALTNTGGVQCWGYNADGQLGDGTTTQRPSPVAVSGLTSGVAAAAGGSNHTCALLGAGALVCWGDNTDGQLGDGTTTDQLTPATVAGLLGAPAAVAPGTSHTCALLSDGAVRCWGDNAYGQLGDGTTDDHLAPVGVSGLAGGEGVVVAGGLKVAAGAFHACAVTTGGGVKCWGRNDSGQLGDGTTTSRTIPTGVVGLSNGVATVGAGYLFTCALTTAGGVKCWGGNPTGQLGDGTTSNRATPVDVTGLASGVVALAVGPMHACAVTSAGGVKCWGQNTYGQLGDGTTTNRSAPVDVSGLTSDIASVTAGLVHSCALTSTGGVRCWGHNGYGQIGDGTTTDHLTWVSVNGLTSGVSSVAAGGWATCAVTNGGGAKCWGMNAWGQVGDGTTANRTTPTDVVGLTSDVVTVRPGESHTCGIARAGRAKCWGANSSGQLGDGTTTNRSTPVDVSGLSAGVTDLSAGEDYTCAVVGRGGVECWGANSFGQLGDGTTTDFPRPVWVSGLLSGRRAVGAGGQHTCRVSSAGGVQCWGSNSFGQLGDGTTTDRATPGNVIGLGSGVVAVSAGEYHTCALTASGGLKCWGYNTYGQLGDGTVASRATPVDVSGLSSGVVAVVAGGYQTCALAVSGGMKCWGLNTYGQLGDGTTTYRLTPVWVLGLSAGVTAITTRGVHACALTAGGGVKCWGRNVRGQLGDGTTTDRSAPVWVGGLTSGVIGLAAGTVHTCALTTGGGVKCWGYNYSGQLGDDTTTDRLTPTDVAGMTSGAVDLTAGLYHTCALTRAGGLMCWGDNSAGQLGDGTTTQRTTPVVVSGLAVGAAAPYIGALHSCVVAASGAVKCWGANTYGQLGDGTTTQRTAPMPVRAGKLWQDFDGDVKADVAVYRPASGTWFSLNSSAGNATYQSRGWGIQAQNDTPAPGDYDGDGVVDPTVFRPGTGTWFILESSTNYTIYSYFGWGASGDTPVPADYDGDGKTDGAVYRVSSGTWYIRPSSGATQWSVVFGQAGDVPLPGDYDGDGKADVCVYRPAFGTWFVLTSASGFTTSWYRGWGIQAQGDTPAPGDYDGDGKIDLCVYRPASGTWFILETHANYTTWDWFGWGASGDTLVPSDFDGDGITDAAVYRATTGTWYVRPSGGATQWSAVFGTTGDVPLLKIQ